MTKLTESQLTLKKKFTVTSADTDMFGRLKSSELNTKDNNCFHFEGLNLNSKKQAYRNRIIF